MFFFSFESYIYLIERLPFILGFFSPSTSLPQTHIHFLIIKLVVIIYDHMYYNNSGKHFTLYIIFNVMVLETPKFKNHWFSTGFDREYKSLWKPAPHITLPMIGHSLLLEVAHFIVGQPSWLESASLYWAKSCFPESKAGVESAQWTLLLQVQCSQ